LDTLPWRDWIDGLYLGRGDFIVINASAGAQWTL